MERVIDEWCIDDELRQTHHLRPVFITVLVVFMCLEMILCCRFHVHRFEQNQLTLFALAVMEAADMSAWLDREIFESHISDHARRLENVTVEQFMTSSHFNLSNPDDKAIVECLRETRVQYRVFEISNLILMPFGLEFLFLATECVAHWFFNINHHQQMQPAGEEVAVKTLGHDEQTDETRRLLTTTR